MAQFFYEIRQRLCGSYLLEVVTEPTNVAIMLPRGLIGADKVVGCDCASGRDR